MAYAWDDYWEDFFNFTQRMPKNKLSHEYEKYLSHVPLITVFPKVTKVEQKEVQNPYFYDFLKKNYPEFKIPENKWRIPELSVEKSYQEISKYWEGKEVKYDDHLFQLSQELVFLHYKYWMRNTGQLSLNEVIDSWDKSSSAGFYYNMKYKDTNEFIEKEKIIQLLMRWDERLRSNRPLPDIFVSSLKHEELRPIGKNPRTFMGSGKRMLAWKQVLFKSQNDALTKYHRHTWIKSGLSNYHRGFHQLFETLKIKGGKNPLFWDSDVSGWDRSVPAILLEAELQLRMRFWPDNMRTKKNILRAKRLYDLTINSFIILENGEVVQKFKGQPSGDANTLPTNSWIHEMVAVYSLLTMIPREILNNMSMLEVYNLIYSVEMAFMGDDNLGAVDLDKFPWFNTKKLQAGYECFGFVLKSITSSPILEEREFLSRKFIKRDNTWVPLPNREKILCQLMYGNRGTHPKELLQRALGLMRESWGDAELFKVVRHYCEWMFNTFNLALSEIRDDLPSLEILQSQFSTDAQLKEDYCSASF